MITKFRKPYEVLDEMYTDSVPEYIASANTRSITIKAAAWDGAPIKKVRITMEDVAKYFKYQAPSFQSVRTLAGFSTDWRMVDEIAQEALTYFKKLHIDLLRKKCNAIGLTPKF